MKAIRDNTTRNEHELFQCSDGKKQVVEEKNKELKKNVEFKKVINCPKC